MIERRRHIRNRTFLGGRLAISGTSTIDCIVRNISSCGARVEFENAAILPCDVTCQIPIRGISQPARIAWRHQNAAGLVFTI